MRHPVFRWWIAVHRRDARGQADAALLVGVVDLRRADDGPGDSRQLARAGGRTYVYAPANSENSRVGVVRRGGKARAHHAVGRRSRPPRALDVQPDVARARGARFRTASNEAARTSTPRATLSSTAPAATSSPVRSTSKARIRATCSRCASSRSGPPSTTPATRSGLTSGFLPEDFHGSRARRSSSSIPSMTSRTSPSTISIPMHPFFGSVGDAPPASMGNVNSAPPGIHAGNLDNKELVTGIDAVHPRLDQGRAARGGRRPCRSGERRGRHYSDGNISDQPDAARRAKGHASYPGHVPRLLRTTSRWGSTKPNAGDQIGRSAGDRAPRWTSKACRTKMPTSW